MGGCVGGGYTSRYVITNRFTDSGVTEPMALSRSVSQAVDRIKPFTLRISDNKAYDHGTIIGRRQSLCRAL